MVLDTAHQENPRRGLHPSPYRPRTPTGPARDLVVLRRLQVQRWQCKVCPGSASPLPPGVTARPRPQSFRELVTALYMYSVSLRGLVRLLDLLGCGVGAATLWRDVQAMA